MGTGAIGGRAQDTSMATAPCPLPLCFCRSRGTVTSVGQRELVWLHSDVCSRPHLLQGASWSPRGSRKLTGSICLLVGPLG